jgi:hypothetical protein
MRDATYIEATVSQEGHLLCLFCLTWHPVLFRVGNGPTSCNACYERRYAEGHYPPKRRRSSR